MTLNYASLLHVLSLPSFLLNSGLDDDLITSAHARVHVQLQISWKPRPRTACVDLGRRDTAALHQ